MMKAVGMKPISNVSHLRSPQSSSWASCQVGDKRLHSILLGPHVVVSLGPLSASFGAHLTQGSCNAMQCGASKMTAWEWEGAHPKNCRQAVSVRIVDQVDEDQDGQRDPPPIQKLWETASLSLFLFLHFPLFLIYVLFHSFHISCTALPCAMQLLRIKCGRQREARGGRDGQQTWVCPTIAPVTCHTWPVLNYFLPCSCWISQ